MSDTYLNEERVGELWEKIKDEISSASSDGVSSFNGRSGTVTPQSGDYTAEMVGARASDWMPTAGDVGALPDDTVIPSKTSDLTNDSGFITDYTETDPTVPSWAKADTKPSYSASEISYAPQEGDTTTVQDVIEQVISSSGSGVTSFNGRTGVVVPESGDYTASDVGAISTSEKGVANGVAELNESGKIPSSQLPSYVDDVEEYSSIANLPDTGESGKIYIVLDTNKTYRWSGSEYVAISNDLALGETESTAYRGDRGKIAYDHSQIDSGNPHGTTAEDVGAIAETEKGVASGVATLDEEGKVPVEQLPDDIGGASSADAVTYDDTTTALGADNVQDVVEALKSDLDGNFLRSTGGGNVSYSDEFGDAPHDWELTESTQVFATLTADGWSGDSAPYTQTVNIDGVTATTDGSVAVADSATDEQYDAAIDALLRKYAQGDGTMSFKAYGDAPSVDIPIVVDIW